MSPLPGHRPQRLPYDTQPPGGFPRDPAAHESTPASRGGTCCRSRSPARRGGGRSQPAVTADGAHDSRRRNHPPLAPRSPRAPLRDRHPVQRRHGPESLRAPRRPGRSPEAESPATAHGPGCALSDARVQCSGSRGAVRAGRPATDRPDEPYGSTPSGRHRAARPERGSALSGARCDRARSSFRGGQRASGGGRRILARNAFRPLRLTAGVGGCSPEPALPQGPACGPGLRGQSADAREPCGGGCAGGPGSSIRGSDGEPSQPPLPRRRAARRCTDVVGALGSDAPGCGLVGRVDRRTRACGRPVRRQCTVVGRR